MTNYVTPQTWEQCAAHVEAGGVVEIEDAPGVWINDRAATTIYRGRCGTPDDGWAPRRLVPIESAAPANGVPAGACRGAVRDGGGVAGLDGLDGPLGGGLDAGEAMTRRVEIAQAALLDIGRPDLAALVSANRDGDPSCRGGILDGWRECADPVELAAAVAAGVEVQRNEPGWSSGAWCKSRASSEASFAAAMREGNRYRVPASWSWSPEPPAPVTGDDLPPDGCEAVWLPTDVVDEWVGLPTTDYPPSLAQARATIYACREAQARRGTTPASPPAPDDLVSRARGHADTHPESRELIEELLAAPLDDAVHLLDLAWGVIANADGWHDDTSWRQAAERWRDGYHRLLDDIRTTAPVPPWPGAVLSGLCDEDGVPTWLAQAGQVRGEQVRSWHGSGWVAATHSRYAWVEVRAPRAVPEPATERVPWWEAVGREVTDQDGERVPIEHVQCGDGAGPSVTAYNAAERRDTRLLRVPIPVRGDGTVEVLARDGDQ